MRICPGTVTAIDPDGQHIIVKNNDTGKGERVLRPVPNGLTTGAHWMPKSGDKVALFYWADQVAVSLVGWSHWINQVASLPVIPGHEYWIYGPHNNILSMVTNGNINLVTGSGSFVTVNGKKVVLDGDSVSVSGGDPQGGTVNSSGTVTGSGR